MNGLGSSPHRLLTIIVVVLAIADAFAAGGLGGCQRDQMQSAAPPAQQRMNTPTQPDKNAGDTNSNPQKPDQGGATDQKSQ